MNIFDDFVETQRRRHQPAPIQATWALQAGVMIDEVSPGFIAAMLRAKPVKRHAMLAVLASSLREYLDGGDFRDLCPQQKAALKAIGDSLPDTKPREMIQAAFGLTDFCGLGTLARLVEPLLPQDYIDLIQVLSDPAERPRQQVLQHIPRIDHDRLRGVLALDPALCTVRLARKINREQHAQIANDIIQIVRTHRPDLSDEELLEFASQAPQDSVLNVSLERLLGLVQELPALPFPVPEGFRHLRTLADFEDTGRKFSNCIATKFLSEALPERVAYLEYQPRAAIAALLPTNQGYLLSKVHVPGNGAASRDLVEEVRAALAAGGLGYITPAPIQPPLASIRWALMRYDLFGLSPDEFDASAPELDD